MIQINKIIPEIHERYFLSEDGNLFTDYGKTKMSNNYIRNGYISNTFTMPDKTRKQISRHRLMLEVFNPIKNMNQMQVNHKDGNKLNNTLDNLEWVTPKENTRHAWNNHLCDNQVGENHYNHKLTEKQVKEILSLLEKNEYSITELAEIYGVSRRTIGRIRDGESWKFLSQKTSTTIPKGSTL